MSFKTNMLHRSGFVNIVGNSNVGKSTLMNRLVGKKLSIVTSMSQTTRHRIIGIVNMDKIQIIYSDTPGIFQPHNNLQEQMVHFSELALWDADVLIYVTDVIEKINKNIFFLRKIEKILVPVLLIINKIDLSDQQQLERKVVEWKDLLPCAEIIPVSVLYGFQVNYLQRRIEDLLPESPPYFDKDTITDRPARFFVSEIIREKVFLYYQKEIPYAVEIAIECFDEFKSIIRIRAIIMVEKNSQKGIIIGKKGSALKKVGSMARKDVEKFFEKKVFLEMTVRVEKEWKNRENLLQRFGY